MAFSCLKVVINISKPIRHSPTIGGNSSVQFRKVASHVFSSFIVCLNQDRSALILRSHISTYNFHSVSVCLLKT